MITELQNNQDGHSHIIKTDDSSISQFNNPSKNKYLVGNALSQLNSNQLAPRFSVKNLKQSMKKSGIHNHSPQIKLKNQNFSSPQTVSNSNEQIQQSESQKLKRLSSNVNNQLFSSNNQIKMYKNRIKQLEDRLKQKNKLLLQKQNQLIAYNRQQLNSSLITSKKSQRVVFNDIQTQTTELTVNKGQNYKKQSSVVARFQDTSQFLQTQMKMFELQQALENSTKKFQKVQNLLLKRSNDFVQQRKKFEKKVKQLNQNIYQLKQQNCSLNEDNIQLKQLVQQLEQQVQKYHIQEKQNSIKIKQQKVFRSQNVSVRQFGLSENRQDINYQNAKNSGQRYSFGDELTDQSRLNVVEVLKSQTKNAVIFQQIIKEICKILQEFIRKSLNSHLIKYLQKSQFFGDIESIVQYSHLQIQGIVKIIEKIWEKSQKSQNEAVSIGQLSILTIQKMFNLSQNKISQAIMHIDKLLKDKNLCSKAIYSKGHEDQDEKLKYNSQKIEFKQSLESKQIQSYIESNVSKQLKKRVSQYEQIQLNRQKIKQYKKTNKKVHFQDTILQKNKQQEINKEIKNIQNESYFAHERGQLLKKYNISSALSQSGLKRATIYGSQSKSVQIQQDFIKQDNSFETMQKNKQFKKIQEQRKFINVSHGYEKYNKQNIQSKISNHLPRNNSLIKREISKRSEILENADLRQLMQDNKVKRQKLNKQRCNTQIEYDYKFKDKIQSKTQNLSFERSQSCQNILSKTFQQHRHSSVQNSRIFIDSNQKQSLNCSTTKLIQPIKVKEESTSKFNKTLGNVSMKDLIAQKCKKLTI